MTKKLIYWSFKKKEKLILVIFLLKSMYRMGAVNWRTFNRQIIWYFVRPYWIILQHLHSLYNSRLWRYDKSEYSMPLHRTMVALNRASFVRVLFHMRFIFSYTWYVSATACVTSQQRVYWRITMCQSALLHCVNHCLSNDMLRKGVLSDEALCKVELST